MDIRKVHILQVLTFCGVNNADTVISSISSERVNEKIVKNTEEAIGTGVTIYILFFLNKENNVL